MNKNLDINGESFLIKSTARTLVYLERNLRKHNAEKDTMEANLLMIFSSLQANNRDTFKIDFEDFLDLLDENPALLGDAMKAVKQQSEAEEGLPEKK